MKKEMYVTYIAVLTAMFGYIYDFDSAVIASSAASLAKKFQVESSEVGILITIVLIGGLIGGVLAGYFSEKIGRKKTIVYSLLEFIISGTITFLAVNIEMFLLGRFLMGLALGSTFLVGAVYVIEISPSESRGKNGTINQLLMPMGLIIGFWIVYIINKRFSDTLLFRDSWRFLFFLETLQGTILYFLFLSVPESPRWLFNKGREEEARRSLQKVLTGEEAEKVISDLRMAKDSKKEKNIKMSKGIVIALLLTVIFPLFRQFSGINPVIYYAPEIFKELSSAPTAGYYQSIIMGAFEVLGSVITLIYIEKVGRKFLLFAGSLGMIISLGYIYYILFLGDKGKLGIYSVYIYNLTFTVSLGTILTVYISEILPTPVRALGVTIFNFVNYIFDIILTDIFPLLGNISDYFPFFLFFTVSVVLLFFIPFVPETKGKSLEEIEKYWNDI